MQDTYFFKITLRDCKEIVQFGFTSDRARIAACEKALKQHAKTWTKVRLGTTCANGEIYERRPKHGELDPALYP